jgi:hypothetical protein
MPMTMLQILGKTPQSRRDNAAFVRVKSAKMTRTNYNTLKYEAKTYSTHDANGQAKKSKPAIHTTIVETNGKQVVVECSCEDFWAVWEFALNQKKAARIKHSNGQPPVERNPKWRPGCCKHVFHFGQDLLRRGKVS